MFTYEETLRILDVSKASVSQPDKYRWGFSICLGSKPRGILILGLLLDCCDLLLKHYNKDILADNYKVEEQFKVFANLVSFIVPTLRQAEVIVPFYHLFLRRRLSRVLAEFEEIESMVQLSLDPEVQELLSSVSENLQVVYGRTQEN